MTKGFESTKIRVLLLGSGAFAHGTGTILSDHGAEVTTYLTRPSGGFPASLSGKVVSGEGMASPVGLMREMRPGLVIPMSIDWARAEWRDEFLALGIPYLAPNPEGMRLERERDFARTLCERHGICYPASYVAGNRLEAEAVLRRISRPMVIKNPLCSPGSPIHTIVCTSEEETKAWLPHLDYAEGVFLQEYLGAYEVGHIAFISAGQIWSLVSNQEYKRPYSGNMGIVAGVPMGGIVERDDDDHYGLARLLLHPLLPWFREVGYHGPVQVTAVHHRGRWWVVEYNVRLGITCAPLILRLLRNPLDTISRVAADAPAAPEFDPVLRFGCSVTLAGYGFPYRGVEGPEVPVQLRSKPTCDLWWNEVRKDRRGTMRVQGQRIADICAVAPTLTDAIATAYNNIARLQAAGSYYRTDIGQILWPPGSPQNPQDTSLAPPRPDWIP